MQAGTCADVLYLHWREVPVVAFKLTLLPLDDRIRRDAYDVDDFFASCLAAHRFENRQVSLPDKGSTMLLFYNRTLFDREGMRYPDASWTIDDFVAAAKKLTKTDGSGRQVQVGCLPYD